MEKPDEKQGPPRLPSLQELVSRHGGPTNIPREAWEQFDRETEEYRRWLENGWRWTRDKR
jgi:hypothetical protein